mmetsp:Transcript_14868/g.26257  ORF Transcript_14868/g.26257 Transcript_14868/m.26257 type:complete len:214 (-) Transcript_14868:122-763(-)
MASEGSREIEAAKQRLAAANTQAASAAKMMESAIAMSEAAQKEVKVAKTCLSDAEKRWEVINVVSDDESQGIQSRITRRKVSFSPETDLREMATRQTALQPTNDGGTRGSVSRPNDSTVSKLRAQRLYSVEEIRVRGQASAGEARATRTNAALLPSEGSQEHSDGNTGGASSRGTGYRSNTIGSARVKVEECGISEVDGMLQQLRMHRNRSVP